MDYPTQAAAISPHLAANSPGGGLLNLAALPQPILRYADKCCSVGLSQSAIACRALAYRAVLQGWVAIWVAVIRGAADSLRVAGSRLQPTAPTGRTIACVPSHSPLPPIRQMICRPARENTNAAINI